MVKVVKFGVAVLNDDKTSFDQVISAFQDVFCWDITQAHNCANIIHHKGEMVLKWFDHEDTALYVAQVLRAQGLKTKIIIDKNAEVD